MIRKSCCSRFSLHKFVHLKFFWTQFKNMHLRGPCCSRSCISRPYCNVCLIKISSTDTSSTLLSLLRFFMRQTLFGFYENKNKIAFKSAILLLNFRNFQYYQQVQNQPQYQILFYINGLPHDLCIMNLMDSKRESD